MTECKSFEEKQTEICNYSVALYLNICICYHIGTALRFLEARELNDTCPILREEMGAFTLPVNKPVIIWSTFSCVFRCPFHSF